MRTTNRLRNLWVTTFAAAVLLGTGAAGATAATAPDPSPPSGPTVLVNGQPFKGAADPKLPGCTVTLSISGLAPGPHTVAGGIRAVEPSGDGTLATVQSAFDGATWSSPYDLTTAVQGLTQHDNGYRIVVDLGIDGGEPQTSRRFWLACGAPQTGDPFVVVIDKQWQAPDGTVLSGPPAGLPADWSMSATSQLGSAVCTYPTGSDPLVCVYDNKGAHEGATDGLYVPGGKGKTFTISETAPAGWEVVSGVGTFVARDVCPGGHDPDEEDVGYEPTTTTVTTAQPAADDDEATESRPPCPALVVDRQVPSPTTTTVVPTTTAPASVAPATLEPPASVLAAETVAAPTAGTLPATGSDLPLWLGTGVGLLALGGMLLGTRRLARARVRS